MPMVLQSLVMIQRWLSEATKWDNFKVIDVGQHVVDLVATLKDSGNVRIPLQNGQFTNLETVLKIVLEGEKPFDAELITPGVAMDTSEDFQAQVAAALNSFPALLYATLPPKRKSKGKGKAKPKRVSVALLGGPDNAIIIPDSAPLPVPSNPGPPLQLTPLRLNLKAPPGLPPPVNKAPIKAPVHPPPKNS
jgi:hypothetical protein